MIPIKRAIRAGIATLLPISIFFTADTVNAYTFPMIKTSITLNGKTLATPKAFVTANTTYMPLYYVGYVLKSLGIKSTWSVDSSRQMWTLISGAQLSPSLNLNARNGRLFVSLDGKMVEQHLDSIVTIDPDSHQFTTYIPIWYIQKVLSAIGLVDTWDGRTWTIKGGYSAWSKSNVNLGTFVSLSQAELALADYTGGTVTNNLNGQLAYHHGDFSNVDLRLPAPANINTNSINQYLESEASPMYGLGQSFMDAQTEYGVDANYLVSHAAEESSWGNSPIAIQKNNLFGYGAFDVNAGSDAATFPSESYAVLFQAWEIRNNYLNPGSAFYEGSPTLNSIQQNYASDPSWSTKVSALMDQFALTEHDTVSSYPQYSSATSVPAPPISSEPIFEMNGAEATDVSNSYYNGVPVYADIGTGASYMFTRSLQLNMQGPDVEALQTALNKYGGANLPVTGFFGKETNTALEAFQISNGLQPNGICDFNTWSNLLKIESPLTVIPSGSAINVDQIMQGMAGGVASLWYHIPSVGWVNSQYVHFTNVYRLIVATQTNPSASSIQVYSSTAPTTVIGTLHSGDFVVSTNPQAVNGTLEIQFVDQATHTLMSGVVRSTDATLVRLQ